MLRFNIAYFKFLTHPFDSFLNISSNKIIKPENLPEKLIWYYIIGIYPIYLLGALYPLTSLLAFSLTAYLVRQWWQQTDETPVSEKIIISPSVWVWVIAVLVIEFALIVGLFDFGYGISQIIKSSLLWCRGWALLALFPLIGHLKIRSEVIYRAICILCSQSLFIVFICLLLFKMRIQVSYLSPLSILGGVKDSYQVYAYVYDEGGTRLQLFAPWAPALGLVGNIYFHIAAQESDQRWRLVGMAGAVAMIVVSVSRLAIVCLPFVIVLAWYLNNFSRPLTQFLAGFFSFLGVLISPILIDLSRLFKERFDNARKGSSEVRTALQRLALEGWQKEALIWGHGRIEDKGPAITGGRPIGSHHTWLGILYAHGLVGCISLAVALAWTFIDLFLKAQFSNNAKAGLSILLVILLFMFAENIEAVAYLYFPGLIIWGIAFKEKPILVC